MAKELYIKCKSCKWVRCCKTREEAIEKGAHHTMKSGHFWFRLDFTKE